MVLIDNTRKLFNKTYSSKKKCKKMKCSNWKGGKCRCK